MTSQFSNVCSASMVSGTITVNSDAEKRMVVVVVMMMMMMVMMMMIIVMMTVIMLHYTSVMLPALTFLTLI